MGIIQTGRVEIAYETSGSGEAGAVILIRGQGTQLIHWPKSFYEAFSTQGFFTIRFDNRDTGLSGKFDHIAGQELEALKRRIAAGEEIDPPYTMDDMTLDVIALMDELDIDTAHIVGMSMGGFIAQLLAAEYPSRVLSMTSIMSGSGSVDPTLMDALWSVRRSREAFIQEWVEYVRQFGGKGYSLIRMVEAGLPVPSGTVLTTEFFEPWFDEVKASATWSALVEATPDKWATLCSELKGLGLALPLTGAQRQALGVLNRNLVALGDNVQFAVRSSSPEEDLASASFAGGYETRLGVHPAELEDAVRYCFASSLDERVLVYKKEHGFDVLSPRIAVVVQQQIDSEVAGVGFSLNPLTNDYDEAVIDANWGLGESVVAGIASPDHYIVDKFSRQIIEKTMGTKQVSIWLGPDGGTIERKGHRSAEFTLSDNQLDKLTEVFCHIEALYDKPMDIEWTYSGGQLYVLQARPITRYLPLAAEMVTRPGERRRLYVDAALSKGMTLNAPISPMGLSWMEDFMNPFFEKIQLNAGPMKGLLFAAGGRMYMNLSNVMWLVNPRILSKSSTANDALLAEILANIDEKQ